MKNQIAPTWVIISGTLILMSIVAYMLITGDINGFNNTYL